MISFLATGADSIQVAEPSTTIMCPRVNSMSKSGWLLSIVSGFILKKDTAY